MIHLLSKDHHPHLQKRALLEFLGLAVLVGLSINQREVIATAIEAIRNSDVFYLTLLFGMYWLLLPLTAFSYRMLAYRKIPIVTTALAQLAAAGPGRIIPGGLGHISISAIHLHKLGLSMERAILIPVSNNIIGLAVNSTLIMSAVIYHPTLLDSIWSRLSVELFLVIILLVLIVLALLQWLSHVRKMRAAIKRVTNQWKHLIAHLRKRPKRIMYIMLISATTTIGHSFMLQLAGDALSIHIPISDAILALSFGVLLGGAVPTPGGLGAVEAGTTSALILLGYNAAEATSAALLFRTATYWQPLLPGMLSYLYLRERKLL